MRHLAFLRDPFPLFAHLPTRCTIELFAFGTVVRSAVVQGIPWFRKRQDATQYTLRHPLSREIL